MIFEDIENVYDEDGCLVPNTDDFYEDQEHYDEWIDFLEGLMALE